MDYINEYGEVIKIPVSDEVWLDDAFFEREMSKLPLDAPRAGLAYRVSTKGQVDHDDIPMQKIECRKFCVQHGWRVVAEKSEKGVSGSKVSAQKRDAIQYFKSIAENGEIDILLLYIFDRLGRIESETPFVLEWFVKHGVQVWSTREGEQRIENHTDKLLNYIRFWQAERTETQYVYSGALNRTYKYIIEYYRCADCGYTYPVTIDCGWFSGEVVGW